jgi:hypothetical protein
VPRGHSLHQLRLFGLKRWGLGGWGTASVTPSYRSNLHAAGVAEVTRITEMQVVHSAEEPGCASPASSAFLEQETPSAGLSESVALGARSEMAGQVDGLLTIPPDKIGARVVGRHHRNFNRALIPGSRDLFFVKAKPQNPWRGSVKALEVTPSTSTHLRLSQRSISSATMTLCGEQRALAQI